MVTKHKSKGVHTKKGLILAKIHMVTKLTDIVNEYATCLILAKIHMVTKHMNVYVNAPACLILAKIHMVTKHVNS